jgi:hypothetical protein
MKVVYTLNVTEDDRRKVRAGLGKGGLATRNEVRYWLNRLVQSELERLPSPRVRTRQRAASAAATPRHPDILRDSDAPCVNCKRPLGDHIGLALTCPLSKSVKPGSKFKQAAA